MTLKRRGRTGRGRGSLGLSFPRGLALGRMPGSSGPQFSYTENQWVGRKQLHSLVDTKFKCVLQTVPGSNAQSVLHHAAGAGQAILSKCTEHRDSKYRYRSTLAVFSSVQLPFHSKTRVGLKGLLKDSHQEILPKGT